MPKNKKLKVSKTKKSDIKKQQGASPTNDDKQKKVKHFFSFNTSSGKDEVDNGMIYP